MPIFTTDTRDVTKKKLFFMALRFPCMFSNCFPLMLFTHKLQNAIMLFGLQKVAMTDCLLQLLGVNTHILM